MFKGFDFLFEMTHEVWQKALDTGQLLYKPIPVSLKRKGRRRRRKKPWNKYDMLGQKEQKIIPIPDTALIPKEL